MAALATSIQQCGLGQSVPRVGDQNKGIVYGPTQPGSGNAYGAVMFVRSGNLVAYVMGTATQLSSLPDVTTIATAVASRMAQPEPKSESGTLGSRSSSHTVATASLGARQSPRGESEPPEPTLGPFGIADRLNWLNSKKRCRNTRIHVLMSPSGY